MSKVRGPSTLVDHLPWWPTLFSSLRPDFLKAGEGKQSWTTCTWELDLTLGSGQAQPHLHTHSGGNWAGLGLTGGREEPYPMG